MSGFTSIAPSRSREPDRFRPARRKFRDNPPLILIAIGLLTAVLAGVLAVSTRSSQFGPAVLTGFALYALAAADLVMLAALLFVLTRNIVKVVIERRRALPFARFRSRVVVLLLGMTLVPAVLMLVVG